MQLINTRIYGTQKRVQKVLLLIEEKLDLRLVTKMALVNKYNENATLTVSLILVFVVPQVNLQANVSQMAS